jgi:hypothetical protein
MIRRGLAALTVCPVIAGGCPLRRKLALVVLVSLISLAWTVTPPRLATGSAALTFTNPMVECNPDGRTALVTFGWLSTSGATEEWLDLSIFDNRFQPGTFISVRLTEENLWRVPWDGILIGIAHYWRTRVETPMGGAPGIGGSFVPCGSGAALAPVETVCVGSTTATIAFAWAPLAPGGEQWLDITIFDNGFAPGSFISAGPLSPAASSFIWSRIEPNVVHYYRLNTLTPWGWAPSESGTFIADCDPDECTPPPPYLTTTRLQEQTKVGSLTFFFDPTVSPSNRAFVSSGIDIGESFARFAFGRGLRDVACIDVRALAHPLAPGVIGQAHGYRLFIFTGHGVWDRLGPVEKQIIIIHEYAHVLQADFSRTPLLTSTPFWLLEGSADYIALAAMERSGHDIGPWRRANLAEADFDRGVMLGMIETGRGWFENGSPYGLAYVAVDVLLQSRGIDSLRVFYERSGEMPWPQAFQIAFGRTPQQFYDEFENLRAAGLR